MIIAFNGFSIESDFSEKKTIKLKEQVYDKIEKHIETHKGLYSYKDEIALRPVWNKQLWEGIVKNSNGFIRFIWNRLEKRIMYAKLADSK